LFARLPVKALDLGADIELLFPIKSITYNNNSKLNWSIFTKKQTKAIPKSTFLVILDNYSDWEVKMGQIAPTSEDSNANTVYQSPQFSYFAPINAFTAFNIWQL
jgi:hypothetical protein